MKPEIIKRKLKDKGHTQASIARELGLSVTTVHDVINGSDRSRRVAEFVASKLDKTPAKLWPKKYQSTAIDNQSAAN